MVLNHIDRRRHFTPAQQPDLPERKQEEELTREEREERNYRWLWSNLKNTDHLV